MLPEPSLPSDLKRNCEYTPIDDDFENAGLNVGELAENFGFLDINGSEFRLSTLLTEKPVVMIFGAFT